jgi:hypothetical protein
MKRTRTSEPESQLAKLERKRKLRSLLPEQPAIRMNGKLRPFGVEPSPEPER